jgi:hypothetical protein
VLPVFAFCRYAHSKLHTDFITNFVHFAREAFDFDLMDFKTLASLRSSLNVHRQGIFHEALQSWSHNVGTNYIPK